MRIAGHRRRIAWLAFAAPLALLALAHAQGPVLDPFLGVPPSGGPVEVGPTPAGIEAIDAASCGECHREHYAEWRRSAHHTAFTNTLFQSEHGRRRQPFCARCHAPRADESAGVDCAVCHVRDGAVLNPTVSGRAPHASRVAPEVASTLACAHCHQFAFESQPDLLLQRTVEEWMSSRHDETSCQGCHVPARGARHAHDFPGGLDRALLRDAITVSASASRQGGDTRLTLELAAGAAGHAVPTGDVFRRIEVRAWPVGDLRRVESTVLGRRFRGGPGRVEEREDLRVPANGTRRVEIVIEGRASRVAYTIDLWRTLPERAREHGWPARDVRRRLHAGTVRVER